MARSSSEDEILKQKRIVRGSLFSAIRLQSTAFGDQWRSMRGEAETLFPNLKIKKTADLHITVVFIGREWSLAEIPSIKRLSCVAPPGPLVLGFKPVRMGRNKRLVALGAENIATAWTEAVVAAKARLVSAGLKRPDRYDSSFQVHVTLAEAASPPSSLEFVQLEECQRWLENHLHLKSARLEISPLTQPVELLLAGAGRPVNHTDYISLDDFIEYHHLLSP